MVPALGELISRSVRKGFGMRYVGDAPRLGSDMCECGHVRDGHFYGRRSRVWMSCLRKTALTWGAPPCPCPGFRRKA